MYFNCNIPSTPSLFQLHFMEQYLSSNGDQ